MAKDRKLYTLLGVAPSATDDDIRSAYRKLARKYHPDRNKSASAEKRFKEIGSAYQVLSDTTKRKLYDEFGQLALRSGFDEEQAERVRQQRAYAGQGFGARQGRHAGQGFPRQGFAGQDFSGQGFGGQAVNFGRQGQGFNLEDLLRGFGGSADFQSHGSNDYGDISGRSGARPVSLDVSASVELNFVDAAKGAEMMLEIPMPSEAAGVRKQRVRIPAGAADGSILRLRGQGQRDAHNDRVGDLLLTVRVRPHKLFRREALDLHLRLPIDLLEAYEGTQIPVPTLYGTVTLRVPPHSQPGAKLRLRGKGVKRGKKTGDLIVELDVRVPDRDEPGVADALRRARSGYQRPPRADYAA